MSKKKDYYEKMIAYNNYAKTQDVFHIPVKGESTGTFGRDFEIRVRWMLGNYRCKNLISDKKGIDTRKKINGILSNCEFKQRCSTIGEYKNGYDYFPMINSKYICYCMQYLPQMTETEIANNTFILETETFIKVLKDLNLIRRNTKRIELQIQVFYTSKKRTDAFYNALKDNSVFMLKDII